MFLCVYTYYTDSNQNGLGLFIDLSVDDGDDLYDLEYWPWDVCSQGPISPESLQAKTEMPFNFK